MSFIERIETKSGKVLYEKEESEPVQVLTKDESAIMDHLLQAVVDSGTARRLRFRYQLSGPIAGKTGTTQSHADGWFMGYHPNLVAGVWVGAEYPTVRFRTIGLGQGANTALPIYGKFMHKVSKWKATKKWASGRFPEPSEEVRLALNCLPYLDEEPILVDSTEVVDGGFYDAIDDLFEKFRKKDVPQPSKPKVNTSPDREREKALEKERERIHKKNERIKKQRAKKKKRKKRWGGIFGN